MATYSELNGKVAIMSGAGGNAGLSVIQRLYSQGVRLALIDRNEAGLRARLRENNIDDSGILVGAVDLLKKDEIEAFVGNVIAQFGQIDILINQAGGYRPQPPIHEMDEATWDFLVDLNAKTMFLLSSTVAKQMVAKGTAGRIVSVAARGGLKGDPGNAAYAVSKSAVIRMTESMAAELMDHGIRVNVVLPSTLDTPPNRAANPDGDYAKWVSPESLADVLTFLLSDSARDISGAAIPVYGRA
ncbi:MAG: SDR family oxidoreductase [Anaerolineae bacterium]|nr:SDR family oxidoreductase [Anaerolineae bacterium]